jgi:hypothetical protein
MFQLNTVINISLKIVEYGGSFIAYLSQQIVPSQIQSKNHYCYLVRVLSMLAYYKLSILSSGYQGLFPRW